MPRPQALRGVLWRVNGVLGLVVLALAVHLLFVPRPIPTLPRFEFAWGSVGPREPEPSVDREDLLRECARFWPVTPPPKPPERVVRPPEAPTVPPLAAYEVRMWIRRPGEPDCIALACKDPAHPRWYYPVEGRADHGLALDAVRIEDGTGYLTVSRAGDTHTFRYPLRRELPPLLARRVSEAPRAPVGDAASDLGPVGSVAPRGDVCVARRDVKAVPFYGADGKVCGIRVTGIRPGSACSRLGLQRGDVVLRCGPAPIRAVPALLEHLERGDADLDVRREIQGKTREVSLRGG